MSRRTWAVAAVATVLVLGTGGYAVARSRDAAPAYRTAVATRADVQHTLALSGTVSAAGRRDLGFAAAGTVSAVKVRAGAKVRQGQVLARLDPTSFDAAVTSAVASLAKARAQLSADEDAQATAVSTTATASASTGSSSTTAGSGTTHPASASAGGTGNTSGTGAGSSGGGSTGSSGGNAGTTTKPDPALQQALATLKKQQEAVTSAQSDASAALGDARAALAGQQQACQAAAPTSEPTDQPSGQPTSQPTSPPSTGVSAACTGALATVQADQQTVADRQDALQQALNDLAKTLGSAVSTVTKDASVPRGSSTKPSAATSTVTSAAGPSSQATEAATSGQSSQSSKSGQSGSQTGSRTGSPSAGGATVTAARLAQDQAGIDIAQAQLTEARVTRDAATLRAPYAGRVLEVDTATGDRAGTSGTAFVLVGAGGTTVSTSVTTTQVPQVRRGQGVTVLPAGWTTPLTGTVTAIGLLPGSDGSFAVSIAVASTKAVAEGTTASVAITTGTTRNAVTVPTSAVTRTGSRASVEVLDHGVATRTSVRLGVVGERRVAIASGLTAGSTVVLADLGASLPATSSTQNGGFVARRAAGAGGGGFGGGTFRRQG